MKTPAELHAIADQARRDAEAAEAELQRIAAERAEALRKAEDAYELTLIQTWVERDKALEEQALEAGREFTEAIKAGNLDLALKAWINERSTRYARNAIRNDAYNAEQRHKTGTHVRDSLRDSDPNFLARIQEEAERVANHLGNNHAEELMGERPVMAD